MFPDLNFVDYVMALIGILLLVKRVAELEWSHHLKMFILTFILGATLVFFLIAFASAVDNFQCDGTDHFTLTEI